MRLSVQNFLPLECICLHEVFPCPCLHSHLELQLLLLLLVVSPPQSLDHSLVQGLWLPLVMAGVHAGAVRFFRDQINS